MAVTITGLFRNPIRNVPYTSGTVEVAIGDAFGVGDIGYISNARSYKVTADGMNGSGGITLVVDDDAPSDVSFLFPDGVTAAVVSVDGADPSQMLEDLLTEGGDAPTGSTILVQGVVNDPQTNAPRIGMRIEIALVAMFATEDGVYLPVSKSFRMTEYGINNDDVDSLGVTLYVPTGVASQWRFDFYASYADDAPLLWSSVAYLDDSMSVVEVADVLDGLYATWTAPMVAPSNPSVVVSGATRNEVTFTWDDNSDDETGFEVEYSENGTTWNLLTTTAAGVETYTHTTAHGTYPLNLDAVTLYYRVRAVKSGGMSGWASDTLSGLLLRLMAYWKMNEASGTRNDSIGSAHLSATGTINSATGKIGNAAFVDADAKKLDVTNAALQTTGTWEAVFWFKNAANNDTGILWRVGKQGGGQVAYLQIAGGSGLLLTMASDSVNIQTLVPGTWYHLVIGWDGAEGYAYVNNGTKQSVTLSDPGDTSGFIEFAGHDVAQPLYDEAAFYVGRNLNSSLRAASYNSGAGTTI